MEYRQKSSILSEKKSIQQKIFIIKKIEDSKIDMIEKEGFRILELSFKGCKKLC